MNVRIAPISMTLFMFGLDIFMYLSQSHRFWTLFDLSKKAVEGSFRLEGPKLDACKAERGSKILGEGQQAPSPSARGSGERCKLPRF